jgi:hypothetical protein
MTTRPPRDSTGALRRPDADVFAEKWRDLDGRRGVDGVAVPASR